MSLGDVAPVSVTPFHSPCFKCLRCRQNAQQGVVGGREAWVGQRSIWVKCDSEEGRGGDYDQDGETEARLGGTVRVRSCDEH